MSITGSVVVPFATFVAYRDRRNDAAAVPPPATQIDLSVTSSSSARNERRFTSGAANRDDQSRRGSADSAGGYCDAADGSPSGIRVGANRLPATTGIERRS
jgi:hypothetical protein